MSAGAEREAEVEVEATVSTVVSIRSPHDGEGDRALANFRASESEPTVPSPTSGAISVPPPPERGSASSGVSGATGASGLSRGSSLRTGHATAPSSTALLALRAEEAERARGFARIVLVLVGASCAFLPWLGGVPWLRGMMAASLAVVGATAAWVFRVASRGGYGTRTFRIFGLSCAANAIVFQLYLGVFSPTAIVVTLGIAFFGLGADRVGAFGAPALVIVGTLGIALGVTTGVIRDPGVFDSSAVPTSARVFMTVMLIVVPLVTLWQARLSRAAALDAITKANEAFRVAKQREVELKEARLDLDAALRAGAGKTGRYSGSIADQYLLGDVIGRGAMGEVYAAEHVASGALAAVKLMHASALSQPELVQRFLREAQIASRIEVANVVQVLAVGAAADGAPFLAMELLVGEDLSSMLRKKKRLATAEVADLVAQVARGLEAAHTAGVVHRDLKPQNLFLTDKRPGAPATWKILDFGVSKLRGGTGTLTRSEVIGTPGYMAPEQAQGIDAEPRSDVFALAAVAYRALTGRPPFPGDDVPQILFDVVYRSPARPSEIHASIPSDVELVLAIGLAKSPRDRFATPRAFADALRAALKGELSSSLRDAGRARVRALPWGETMRERPRDELSARS